VDAWQLEMDTQNGKVAIINSEQHRWTTTIGFRLSDCANPMSVYQRLNRFAQCR
jgi:hypothetical protein